MSQHGEIFAFLAIFFLLIVCITEQSVDQSVRNSRARDQRIAELEAKLAQAEDLARQASRRNPPIIILSEQDDSYRFASGSAVPSVAFRVALSTEIIPKLDVLARESECDAIEVVGHTDGQVVGDAGSNLDQRMVEFFNRRRATELRPGSNMDLGMMRALAVMSLLKDGQKRGYLSGVTYFFPYSAGQMILPSRSIPSSDLHIEDRARRRIEIRLLQSRVRQLN